MNRPSKTLKKRQIFFWPFVLGIANILGLVFALLGDGIYDLLSWVLLGGASLLIVWLYSRTRAKP